MLDEIIQEAAARAVSGQQNWSKKHIPVTVGDQTLWLSAQVPAEIQQVLDVLPAEPESGNLKRPHQVKTRLSEEELESFEILQKTSGLSQAEYIRGMILHGSVTVTQTSLTDQRSLEQLTAMSATLGKIAGMIRATVIVNKEFAILTPESKRELEAQLRSLRKLQTYIQALAEQIYGNL